MKLGKIIIYSINLYFDNDRCLYNNIKILFLLFVCITYICQIYYSPLCFTYLFMNKTELEDLPPWHYLPSREVATLLGVSQQVLANWRFRKKGPPPVKSAIFKGRSTYYQVGEVLAWRATRRGEAVAPWQMTAGWLQRRFLFPVPLQCPHRTQRVVDQLERWGIYPARFKPKRTTSTEMK
jgi:hypothetical protein